MEIKILGGGCARCERLEKLAREMADELGIEATFTKVKEMDAIMAYDVMSTPALVDRRRRSRSSGTRAAQGTRSADWIRAPGTVR